MSGHDLLGGLGPPPPPPLLREAALAAGRRGMRSAPTPDVWSLLWRSPAARLAWGAVVLLLALAHARVTREAPTVLTAAGAVEPEVAAVSRVSRLAENTPPWAGGYNFEGGHL